MNDGNYAKYFERAKQYTEAHLLRESVQQLQFRWRRYNFPVQELLKLLLRQHGLDAAVIATNALDRQFYNEAVTPPPVMQQSGVTSCCRKGILRHERCIKAHQF